ncbi:MAG: hypothetical protein HYY96_09270 [Candidatus Tectomicrobia bacterium]|nr:hypothetical protein [Candidatus Tectomicrobia bacterium]
MRLLVTRLNALEANDRGDHCLNIGCGTTAGEGWINIDASFSLRLSKIPGVRTLAPKYLHVQWPSNVMYGDIVKGLKVQEGSIRLIFASHILEHLSKEDFHSAISNIYKYVAIKGYFRCIVPDLELMAEEYLNRLSSKDYELCTSANTYFLTNSHLGFFKTRMSFLARIKEVLSNARHQWMWDRYSLSRALKDHGFREVKFCVYGEWADERFGEVEDSGRHKDSICIEARKM